MTKRALIRKLKQITTGDHGHDAAAVYKSGRSWKIETNFESTCRQIAQQENGLFFHHDRNEATISEIESEFNYAWDFLRN